MLIKIFCLILCKRWINTTPVVLSNTNGLHAYQGVAFYGCTETAQITADGVQRAIVMYVKGSDANHEGNDSNKEAALRYAANNYNSVGTFGVYSFSLNSTQIQNVKNDLNNGDYLIGNMCLPDKTGGHSVAIKDYMSSTDEYRILDPWNNRDLWYNSCIFTSNSFYSVNSNYKITWIQYCR